MPDVLCMWRALRNHWWWMVPSVRKLREGRHLLRPLQWAFFDVLGKGVLRRRGPSRELSAATSFRCERFGSLIDALPRHFEPSGSVSEAESFRCELLASLIEALVLVCELGCCLSKAGSRRCDPYESPIEA